MMSYQYEVKASGDHKVVTCTKCFSDEHRTILRNKEPTMHGWPRSPQNCPALITDEREHPRETAS
jgi:hypothetical protein